ncbi:hypothetical protein BFZC1_00650 [Lysinibacillus fusiformis ZC1]|nr:hypothetical protein BFZC1_00650 [Lysinibacillus fusiformis ZC1]
MITAISAREMAVLCKEKTMGQSMHRHKFNFLVIIREK